MPQLEVPVLVVPLVHFFFCHWQGPARHLQAYGGPVGIDCVVTQAGRSQFTTNNTGPTESQDSGRRHLGATTRLHLLCDCH